MATFYFRAATTNGDWQQGSRNGASERAVAEELKAAGLIPVYVGAQPEAGLRGGVAGVLRGPSRDQDAPSFWRSFASRETRAQDRLRFTEELATLLQSGVPLDRALSICSELAASPAFRRVVGDVLRQVKGGKSLAEALEAHGRIFSKLYVNMVRAGQASGTLPLVFQRLAEHEAATAEWRGHIVSALIYPVLLIGVAVASIGVLMRFVIPRFAQVFESTGLAVPASTALLLGAGDVLERYGWLMLAAFAGIVLLFVSWLRSAAGRETWDRFVLRAPVLGELLRKAETARFARTMSTLVSHGVPLVEALRIGKETVLNRVMSASLDGVIQGVKRGEGVAVPVSRAGAFPPLAVHLLRVGEETGRLDAMFERLAGIYERETREALRRAMSLFEPLVILTMGLIVGAIVLSLLVAITSINEIPF